MTKGREPDGEPTRDDELRAEFLPLRETEVFSSLDAQVVVEETDHPVAKKDDTDGDQRLDGALVLKLGGSCTAEVVDTDCGDHTDNQPNRDDPAAHRWRSLLLRMAFHVFINVLAELEHAHACDDERSGNERSQERCQECYAGFNCHSKSSVLSKSAHSPPIPSSSRASL